VRQPFVPRIILPFYQPVLFESGDYARHRRRLYLFGARELTKGQRTAKHYDREG